MNTLTLFKYLLTGFFAGIGFMIFIIWIYGLEGNATTNGAVFSPGEGEQIIYFIDGAKKTLDIEIYVFTSEDIFEALERAVKRGVRIRVILEKDTLGSSNKEMFDKLSKIGVEVKWAKTSGVMHTKFIIKDGNEVMVGSHNFTDAALERNREASVIVRGKEVDEFKQVFETDWALA